MEIREVPTNHSDLLQLVKELDAFFVGKWGQQIAEGYQELHNLSQMAYALICYDNKKLVGCGCYKVIDHQTVEIKRMYVNERYRRQGIATKILNRLEKKAVSEGFVIAELETGKDMQDNILMYQKCGYDLVENYGVFKGDNICICMKKNLK